MPTYKGQDSFTGKIIHSHCYRKPEDFSDSTVVCVGAGPSGLDIALDLYKHAKTVYLSHWRGTLPMEFPNNIVQVPAVDSLHGKTVTFTDGQSCEADDIILCTGYEFRFPFLSTECHMTVQDQRISPLYKHMFHAEFPSLSFIGLPFTTCPFPQFSCQVRLAIAFLEGTYKLPPKEEIDSEIKSDLQRRLDMGWPLRHAHKMGYLQWEYNSHLAQLGGFTPILPVVEHLYKKVRDIRSTNVWHYKELNFEIVDEENWRRVERK